MKYTAVIVQHNYQSSEWAQQLHCSMQKEPYHSFPFYFLSFVGSWLAHIALFSYPQSVWIWDYFCSTGSLLADITPWFMDTSYINPFLSHSSRYETTVHRTKYSSISWILISTVFTGTLQIWEKNPTKNPVTQIPN